MSIGRLRPDTVVPYAATSVSHLLPRQALSPFLCWHLLTMQRITAELVSSVPARVPSRPWEVPKQQVPLGGIVNCIDFFARLKCNEQLKRSYKPQTHQIYPLNAITYYMVTSGRTFRGLLTT